MTQNIERSWCQSELINLVIFELVRHAFESGHTSFVESRMVPRVQLLMTFDLDTSYDPLEVPVARVISVITVQSVPALLEEHLSVDPDVSLVDLYVFGDLVVLDHPTRSVPVVPVHSETHGSFVERHNRGKEELAVFPVGHNVIA